jgi:CHAT domain-containing protein
MRSVAAFVLAVAATAWIFCCQPSDAVEFSPPRNQTFPSLTPELEPLRQTAYDDAVARRAAEATAVLDDMARRVADTYGEQSREMLDFYRDAASLLSIAGDGAAALDRSRKAVALARSTSPAYAFYSLSDPTISLVDQTLAFRDFVALADTHRSDVASSTALLDEAFQVSQMADLDKVSLAAVRKIQAARLTEGEQRDLASLTWMTSDKMAPLNETVQIFVKLGEEMAAAGTLTQEDVDLLQRDVGNQAQAIALIAQHADKLQDVLLPNPLRISQVQSLLDEEEAYVSFIEGSDGYLYVFCITREDFAFENLDFAAYSAEELISSLRNEMRVSGGRGVKPLRPIANEPSKDVLDKAWKLYELLFADIQRLVSEKSHILLSVHGELAKFPFEALVTQTPGPDTTFSSAAWFLRKHAITVVPTVAILSARGSRAAAKSSRLRYLGIGAPDYGALSALDRRPRETRDIERLPGLPESADEARRIGRSLDSPTSDILIGEAANEINLQRLSRSGALAKYDVILFATHGLLPMDVEGAFEGGLALTPTEDFLPLASLWRPFAANFVTDGLLTSREIANLELDADLVILSACNTGSDSTIDNEGYSGLARAFLLAGARSLIVSHWPVVSDAAVAITTRTMAALGGARPSGKALALAYRQALLEVIASGSAQANPRYWAPFSVLGGA